MTTKEPLYKQIIFPIGKDNITKLIAFSSNHIVNLNRALKNIKSEVIADYVCSKPIGITIVISKIASSLDLQVVKNYVKNIKNINSEDIETPRLS